MNGNGKILLYLVFLLLIIFGSAKQASSQNDQELAEKTTVIPLAKGWAQNSINAVIFRQNSITTYKNTQYTGYYDAQGNMVLAKRKIGTKEWEIHRTRYKTNIKDAHNAISLAIDGNGLLHVSWDMHGQDIIYAQGINPGSLQLTEPKQMTGQHESGVTYPAFYRLPSGDLLFMYRRGSLGSGDCMLNRYDIDTNKWQPVVHPLIDGEGERNAYVNTLAIDDKGDGTFRGRGERIGM